MSNVIGPLPEKYKQEVQDVGWSTYNERKAFLKKVADFETQVQSREQRPFDRQGCKKAYMDLQAQAFEKHKHRASFRQGIPAHLRKEDNVLVEDFDLEEFTNPDRFELIAEKDIEEPKLIDGIRIHAKTGTWKTYRIKDTERNISIQIPIGTVPKEKVYERGAAGRKVVDDKKEDGADPTK